MRQLKSTYLRMAKTPTRLELHRLKYHKEGMKVSLLTMDELEPEEHSQLSADFFQTVRKNPGRDPYEVYVEVMADWGVMCHHPQSRRLYEGNLKFDYPNSSYRWYLCTCCGSHVPNNMKTPPTQRYANGEDDA